MKFTLLEKSRNRLRTTFHVVNEAGDVCGSVNVPPDQAADLLRHWVGGEQSAGPKQQQSSPVKLPPIGRMSRLMVLRGC
jgi:hypothetical protein